MSVLKSELKLLVTHDIGVRVDDSLEAAKRELAVLEGRQAAFTDGSKTVETLLGYVDKDIEEGKLDIAVAAEVKKFLMRGSNALQTLAQQAVSLRIAQSGKIQGLEQTVALLKNLIDSEKTRVETLKAEALAPPAERPPGSAPMSIKEQRLAEEAAEAAKAAQEAPAPEAVPDAPLEVVQVTVAAEAPQETYPPAPEPETIAPPVPMNGYRKKQGKKSHASHSR